MLGLFFRIIKIGFQNFIRDRHLTIATVFILILALFLINSVFLFKQTADFLINVIQEKVDISIYFKEDVGKDEVLKLRDDILNLPEVKDVKFISKEDALAQFKEKYAKDPLLMQALEEIGNNPFLNILNIKAKYPDQYSSIVNFLEKDEIKKITDKIDYYERKPIIEKIVQITSFINKAGIVISVFVIFLAILVTFNTIRLVIFNNREEIKIQKLVGASSWFIRGPYLLQGVISGIIAAIISLIIISIAIYFLSPKIQIVIEELNIGEIFYNNLKNSIYLQFLSGILLGMIASSWAIRKYLKI